MLHSITKFDGCDYLFCSLIIDKIFCDICFGFVRFIFGRSLSNIYRKVLFSLSIRYYAIIFDHQHNIIFEEGGIIMKNR